MFHAIAEHDEPRDGAAAMSDRAEIPPFDRPYLLILNIPVHEGPGGRWYVEPLWAKDLVEHLRYLPRFALAAPRSPEPPLEGFVPIPEADGFRVVPLGPPRPRAFAALGAFGDARRLWHAIGEAEVVHYGVAGWPFPLGWLAAPIARVRGRRRVAIVESAPWRADRSASIGSPRRLVAAVYEAMARRCVSAADVAIFTQSEYRDSLLDDPSRGRIIPASWIDESAILAEAEAEREWSRRLDPPGATVSLAFAGRLVAEKGIPTLLDAARLLDARGLPVEIHLYGDGPLRDACEAVARGLAGPTRLVLGGVVPYGPSFFEAIRGHHAVVVPSLGDEQPRVVYDAWSQAVPILASDTPGLRDCLADGAGGRLVPSGDPAALADAIGAIVADPGGLRPLGLAGLDRARALTHQEMHRRRRLIFAEVFESNGPGRTDPAPTPPTDAPNGTGSQR